MFSGCYAVGAGADAGTMLVGRFRINSGRIKWNKIWLRN